MMQGRGNKKEKQGDKFEDSRIGEIIRDYVKDFEMEPILGHLKQVVRALFRISSVTY